MSYIIPATQCPILVIMKKVAIKRPLLIAMAFVTVACILYGQQNYRIIPDYKPPVKAVVSIQSTESEKNIVVVAVGDISCSTESPNYNGGLGNSSGCHMKQTAELARRLHPDALLLLGDLQYEKGDLEQFQQSYAKTWGAHDLKVRSKPSPGNHEYATRDAAGYYSYFGDAAGDPAKGYYSYDLGGWHLVALNSNCDDVPCGEGSQQLSWLKNDLKQHKAKCTLAYYHHPLFSSGSHGNNNFMKPVYSTLYNNGVDLVLAGHDHLYERFDLNDADGQPNPSGVRGFVVGTGGKSLYPFRKQELGSEVRISSAFGVLKLELAIDSYIWQFIDEQGNVLDAGSEACRYSNSL